MNVSVTSLVLSTLSSSPFAQVTASRGWQTFTARSVRAYQFAAPFAMFSQKSSVFIKSCQFSQFLNSAIRSTNEDVIAVSRKDNHTNWSNEDNLTIEGSVFTECNADDSGGAVFVVFSATFICNLTTFSKCNAKVKGGAIYCMVNDLQFSWVCFSECHAPEMDVLACVDCVSQGNVTSCSVHGIDDSDGDGVFGVYGHIVYMSDNNFSLISDNGKSGAVQIGDIAARHISRMEMNTIKSDVSLWVQGPQGDVLEGSNFIGCTGVNVITADLVVTLERCRFRNTGVSDFVVSMIGADNLDVLTVVQCQFDLPQEKAVDTSIGTFTVQDSTFNLGENVELNDLGDLSNQKCHSFAASAEAQYRWRPPVMWVQVVVGVVIVVIILVGIASAIALRRYRRNKADKNNLTMAGTSLKLIMEDQQFEPGELVEET